MSAAPALPPPDDAELAALLSSGAVDLAIGLSAADIERLVAYVRLIERWNATYNLTAIRDPRDMVAQHVLDCLAAAGALNRRRGARRKERLVDVGSGAGLPGVVIAMASPSRDVTCVDSVGKKAAFVTQAAGTLGLKNLTALHQRVEAVSGRFDVVASRAFASLGDFVAATKHLLSETGTWMAMKGKAPDDELAALGDRFAVEVEPLTVPKLHADRCVVWFHPKTEASARS